MLDYDGIFNFDVFCGESDHEKFSAVKFPRKGTPILTPQEDGFGIVTGVMEPILKKGINKVCKKFQYIEILDNVKLPIINRNYSYHPDICLFDSKNKIFVDIEIDEPYDIVTRKPTHYLHNGDNLRDKYFTRNGWVVLRYSEQQICEDLDNVVSHIMRTLMWITKDATLYMKEPQLCDIERWSYDDAFALANDNFRESYLNIQITPPISTDPLHKEHDIDTPIFIKPQEDILPDLNVNEEETAWKNKIEDLRCSNIEHCCVTNKNGYKWIYTTKTLHTINENGYNHITGNSILGFEKNIILEHIRSIEPLNNLFSNIHFKFPSNPTMGTSRSCGA